MFGNEETGVFELLGALPGVKFCDLTACHLSSGLKRLQASGFPVELYYIVYTIPTSNSWLFSRMLWYDFISHWESSGHVFLHIHFYLRGKCVGPGIS